LQLSIADRRVRTASFGASICLVALACTVLLINSRAVVFLEGPAIQVVSVQVETRTPPNTGAHARRSGVATTSTTAPPTATALPVAREILARVQACASPHAEDRPANCPQDASAQDWQQSQRLPVGGDFYQPPYVDPRQVFSRAELATIANVPPCQVGFHAAVIGPAVAMQYCARPLPDPPLPSRSAEEVCDAGGIGPCHPPAFRPQDIVMARHTE
jgi:hypothetical protein